MKKNLKKEKEAQKKIEEVTDFLNSASPVDIYKYFETKNEIYFKLKDKIIQKILKKKDKIINLALAAFSYDDDLVEYLYAKSNDLSIKLAAITNSKRWTPIFCTFFGNDEKKLVSFLKKAKPKELEAFFSHSNYNEYFIDQFLDKSKPYNLIPEKKYAEIIGYLEKNPNTKEKSHNDLARDDGMGWYENQKLAEKFRILKLKYK